SVFGSQDSRAGRLRGYGRSAASALQMIRRSEWTGVMFRCMPLRPATQLACRAPLVDGRLAFTGRWRHMFRWEAGAAASGRIRPRWSQSRPRRFVGGVGPTRAQPGTHAEPPAPWPLPRPPDSGASPNPVLGRLSFRGLKLPKSSIPWSLRTRRPRRYGDGPAPTRDDSRPDRRRQGTQRPPPTAVHGQGRPGDGPGRAAVGSGTSRLGPGDDPQGPPRPG